jgi:hypothetical protein
MKERSRRKEEVSADVLPQGRPAYPAAAYAYAALEAPSPICSRR